MKVPKKERFSLRLPAAGKLGMTAAAWSVVSYRDERG
jgi:hypothetical protein